MNRNVTLLAIFALVVALAANFYFVLAAVNTPEGMHPFLTEKANSHFVSYLIPATGFSATGSLLKDPCLLEEQNNTVPRLHLNYAIYGAIMHVLDDPFWTHFIGNVLLMVLTVGIAILLGNSEYKDAWIGVLIGGLIFFNWAPTSIVKFPSILWSVLIGTFSWASRPFILPLTVTITRTLATPVMLLALYLFLEFVKTPSRKLGVALGIVLALSPFVHFFIAVILFISIGLASLFLVWKKRIAWKQFIVPAAISIPPLAIYAIFVKWASAQPFFGDLAVDFVIYNGHSPMFPPVVPFLALVVAGIVILLSKRSIAFKAFSASMVIATLLATNLQIVLGQNPQPNNWWQWTYLYLIPLAGAAVLTDFIQPLMRRNWKVAKVVAGILLIGLLLAQGISTYEASKSQSYIDDDWYATLGWLQQNVAPDKVVLAPLERSYHVNLFGNAKTYVCDSFQNTATFEENAIRYLQAEWIYKSSPDVISERITNFSTKANFILHLAPTATPNIFGKLMSRTYPAFPGEGYNAVLEQREQTLRALAQSPQATGVSYALDYVVVRNGNSLQDCITKEPVFVNSEYTIFAVNIHGCI